MTAANLAIFVGCTGMLRVGDLLMPIFIKDARTVFNRRDFLVTPTGGSGETWVAADRVSDLVTP